MGNAAAGPNDAHHAWMQDVLGVDTRSSAQAPKQSVAMALLIANRDKLETVRAEALVRMGRLTMLETASREAIGAVKTRLMVASSEYDLAYASYARVIQAAKQEAENQQMYTDIVVGIAIGVLVGVTIEAVPVLLAVEAVASAAAGGVKAAGKAALKAVPGEAAGEGAEAGLGAAAKAIGIAVAGTNLDPGNMRPEILKMGIWKSLTELHEAAPKIGGQSLVQGLLMSSAEYAIGEIKGQGGGADMDENDVADMVSTILSSGASCKEIDSKLTAAEQKVAALMQAGAVKSTYTSKQMEVDIWKLWMASLAKDSNILDIDAIEDYLGPEGLKLVDFGAYTSDDDENEAIAKAKGEKAELEKRRAAALAAGDAKPVEAAEDAAPGSTNKPP